MRQRSWRAVATFSAARAAILVLALGLLVGGGAAPALAVGARSDADEPLRGGNILPRFDAPHRLGVPRQDDQREENCGRDREDCKTHGFAPVDDTPENASEPEMTLASAEAAQPLLATIPSGCTSSTVDLRVLVIASNGNEADLRAIRQALDTLGTPYTLWIATQNPGQLAAGRLWSGCHALYQGVILTNGSLGYIGANGAWVTSALTDAEWLNLATFEANFGIRRVSWYTYPSPSSGFQWPATNGVDTSSTPLPSHLTQAGQAAFAYVQPTASITVEGAWAYQALPLADGTTTVLLSDPTGYALAATHVFPNGREMLSLTFDSNPHLRQDLVLWYGVINWVTRGLFMGERHVYLSPEIDDIFSAGTYWPAGRACDLSWQTGLSYRSTGADLSALLTWQRGLQAQPTTQQLVLSFALIGIGATGGYSPDTLTPFAQANASAFRWINHTYTHPVMDGMDYATASSQVTTNNALAARMGFAPYATANLVTPALTGLTTPSVLQAAYDAGVRQVVTDAMAAGWGNPSPNEPLVLSGSYGTSTYRLVGVPRHPTNLYYNVSTPPDWLSEDQCRFPAGQYGYAATYQQLLSRESDVLVSYLLSADADPLEFHDLNIRAYDGVHSLLSDLLDMTLQKYSSLVSVPVVSVPLDGIAARMSDRMQIDAVRASTAASVVTSSSGSVLVVTFSGAGTVPITGVSSPGAEIYAGQPITRVGVTGPGSATYPLSSVASQTVGVSLNPVQDTYIDSNAPNSTSGGTSTVLASDQIGTTTAFLRFDLSALANRTLTSADLRIHTSSMSWAGSAAVHRVNVVGDILWQEQWMSFHNTVPITNTVMATFTAPAPATWYDVPLDAATVQAHLGAPMSMAIQGLASDILIFDSRESGAATAPQLVVIAR